MMLSRSVFLPYQQVALRYVVPCHICTAATVQSKSKVKLTKKFLMQEDTKKRAWYNDRMDMMKSLNLDKPKGKPELHTARLRRLNKVFMDHITDIMASEELIPSLPGHSLEISKVHVLPKLQGIHVHWICSGTDTDDHTEAMLQQAAYTIRHELSQLRVLGHVPPITFVRDKRFHATQIVENLLAKADYGEDFVPADPTHELRATLTANIALNDKLKKTINSLVAEDGDPFADAFQMALSDKPASGEMTDDRPHDLPLRRGDVLGVDTHKIYTRIQQNLTKAKAEHRKGTQSGTTSSSQLISESLDTFQRTEDIRKWAGQYKLKRQQESQRRKKDESYLQLYHDNFDESDDEYDNEVDIEEDYHFEAFDIKLEE